MPRRIKRGTVAKRITIALDAKTVQTIEALAWERDRSISSIVAEIVKRVLGKRK